MSNRRIDVKITRLYVKPEGCKIRVDNKPEDPKKYYFLPIEHPNYQSIYSLVATAAVNRYIVWVQLVEDTSSYEILYVVVDWPQ